MSVVRGVGLDVQKSKFAALAIDSLSDDSEDEMGWNQVKPPANIGKHKPKGKQGPIGQDGGVRPLSKNAKKRARKKRQQALSESSDTKDTDSASKKHPDQLSPSGLDYEHETRMRNQAAIDLEFQKDLEKAILMSRENAQEHAKEVEDSKLAERVALAASLSSSKGDTPTKTGSKKGVTLSLQEFHRGNSSTTQRTSTMDPHSQLSEILFSEPLPMTPTTPDDHFFDRLTESVQVELQREESKKTEKRLLESHQETTEEDLPRIAQLKDDLEKKDVLVEKLRKQNELLKKTLKEVKQRNQSLCKILSQGEFSTKAQLIEQIDQLTTVKNELTEEVETLHSSLEQEKSKTKTLKVELAKLLGGSSKNGRTASSS